MIILCEIGQECVLGELQFDEETNDVAKVKGVEVALTQPANRLTAFNINGRKEK